MPQPAQPSARRRRPDPTATANSPEPQIAPSGQFAPPPKLRRRPLLILVAVALVVMGALGGLWAYTSTSTAQDVLTVRQTIERGQLITADNLIRVKVGVDPALHPVPGADIDKVIGKRAALDIPAGGVLTAEQITDQLIPAKGYTVVGISLAPGMMPAGQLAVGDHVRIVTTPGPSGEIPTTEPEAIEADIVAVSTESATGATVVNVSVPALKGPVVAARAATGKVAIILDSRDR